MINMSLFVYLPALGKTQAPPPPQVIKLDFLAWQQPVEKKVSQPKKVKFKPKKVIEKKPKPKKKKIIKPKKPKVEKPKIDPIPQPVLSETVVPDKLTPAVKPTDVIEEPVESPVVNVPIPENAEFSEEALPAPVPIFKLTSLPRMIHRQTPVYPDAMKQEGREATVKLEIFLDTKGKVRKVTVIKSGGDAFDQAAIDAIQHSTFMPANIEGKPVNVLMKIPVKFRLR